MDYASKRSNDSIEDLEIRPMVHLKELPSEGGIVVDLSTELRKQRI